MWVALGVGFRVKYVCKAARCCYCCYCCRRLCSGGGAAGLSGLGLCSMAFTSSTSLLLSVCRPPSEYLSMSASLRSLARSPLQCLSCFLVVSRTYLLKAVASRPCCCCHYVLTSDLTPRERPTGRKVCGTFWNWKRPTHEKKETEAEKKEEKGKKKRKKERADLLAFQLLGAVHRE